MTCQVFGMPTLESTYVENSIMSIDTDNSHLVMCFQNSNHHHILFSNQPGNFTFYSVLLLLILNKI